MFGQSLLHRRPPGGRVFGERVAPAADRPWRRGLVHATPLGDLHPGGDVLEARDDHDLNHGEAGSADRAAGNWATAPPYGGRAAQHQRLRLNP